MTDVRMRSVRTRYAAAATLAVVLMVLSGCWTVQPERYIEFTSPLEMDRADLAAGTPVSMEIENDRLVATAVIPGGATALFYVDRTREDDPHLTAADVSRTVIVPAPDGGASSLRAMETCDDALLFFPVLTDFRSATAGFEEPGEDDPGPIFWSTPSDGRSLFWQMMITVPAPAGAPTGVGPVSVEFRVSGSEEGDTRRIFVFVRAGGAEVVRFSLPRTTFGMKELLDAEVQRLLRSVRRNDRYLLIHDRLVDLSEGTVTPLTDRNPGSYIDHISWDPAQGVAAFVYGTPRISKKLVVVPLTP